MEITIRNESGVTVVCINGQLDGTTSREAEVKITPLITPGCRLVFDMGNCNYISSAGLRLLLVIAKQLEKQKGTGVFASLTGEIVDVMKMTGFDTMFSRFASVDDAKHSFSRSQ